MLSYLPNSDGLLGLSAEYSLYDVDSSRKPGDLSSKFFTCQAEAANLGISDEQMQLAQAEVALY